MHITQDKKDFIRRRYIAGQLSVVQIAEKLKLQRTTVRCYVEDFRVIHKDYPERLEDFDFFVGKSKVTKVTLWYRNLIAVLPQLVAEEPGPVLKASVLYRRYIKLFPNEYSSVRFYALFKRWFDENVVVVCASKLQEKFNPEELKILHRWRKSNDRRRWQIAVALMTVYTYHSFTKLAQRIECTTTTLRHWLHLYQIHGLAGLDRDGQKRPMTTEQIAAIDKKMDELVHLVRQPPKNYGVDRASWSLTELALAYSRQSGQFIAVSTVSNYLKRRGVRFKRSREVIVSTDPDFLEKYEAIQTILGNLGEKEKFFSVDEYGPKSVRPKGGRILAFKEEYPVHLKFKKSKGWFICTCALELSTNQITWFYSLKKDTAEMIRLIEVLIAQYHDQEKLYLSWDAAAWHSSKMLTAYLDECNASGKLPLVILAPLPSRTPNLNVIESVFSGLSKSVIHNSDYDSLEDCKDAIDRYFTKRNNHFLENPKKAGQKTWGKEKVRPVFNKANICKNL